MYKRVVVTGMGAVTPIGNTADKFWISITEGKHGIGEITHFDTSELKVKLGAEVKNFVYENRRGAVRMDRISQFGVTAAAASVKDSGLISGENIDPYRFGVICGTGIGGIITIENEVRKAKDKGITRVSALLVPMVIPNIPAGNIAIALNTKAGSHGIVTACAAGTHSIGEAFRSIKHGYADAIIAGGAEAAFAPVCFSGFVNMTALSTRCDPDRCSTPFDKERDGFVMGEGAGFLILEGLEHAKARGAKIYCEVVGYGDTCDAYHLTASSPDGEGAAKAMKMAIDEAGIKPGQVDYINAHGTGTQHNDLVETKAIKMVFGDSAKVPVSSTKSMTGHLLGAAGGIEAVVCVKAIIDGFIPPTINLRVPDEDLGLDYVPNAGRKKELTYAMSNSFGFGGHNGTIVFKKYI